MTKDARHAWRITLSDADVAAKWLNAAKAAKATASYERVVSIRLQIEEFEMLRVKLQEYRRPDPRALEAANRRLEGQRAILKAGEKPHAVHFAGGRGKASGIEYKRLHGTAERLHSALTKALFQYSFRPRVTYFVGRDIWLAGMVPDDNAKWFQTKIGSENLPERERPTISEADAVLALVRLHLIGEIERVRFCGLCQERWLAVTKSDQRYCSKVCRTAFYAMQPDYLERKAKNQRKYRKEAKRRDALARQFARHSTGDKKRARKV